MSWRRTDATMTTTAIAAIEKYSSASPVTPDFTAGGDMHGRRKFETGRGDRDALVRGRGGY